MNSAQAIKEGNKQVYREVFEAYHEKLYRYIYKYTQSPYYAEETVQIAFTKLWEQRAGLSEQHPVDAQLFRIAKSAVIDLLRKEKVREWQSLPEALPLYTTDHEQVVYKDELQRVMAAIEALPSQSRQVFSLSRFESLSHKEISDRLSISTKTIEGHISRPLKQLRKSIATLF